ncbi:MAG: Na+/H+ antiporter NhaC family protein [Anaerovoracaceae bacterium]|jgi:Na+/H+ antiporter NhaC
MDTNQNGRLEFYGGRGVSLLPLLIFLVMIFFTTFVWASISDGALWVPAFVALIIPFFLAKDKLHYSQTIISGMASKECLVPIVCWIFAGAFSRVLRESGLADGIAGLAAGFGVGPTPFLIITFIASAVFATASGTGFGTIAAGMGVLYPAGVALGCDHPLLAGAIISGAAFGDNLAPISDTTICSATTQGVDVPGVVRSRLKYTVWATIITIPIFIVLSMMRSSSNGAAADVAQYNPWTLIMLIPVAITIWIAVKTGDIIIATTWGIVIGFVFAIPAGLIDFVHIDSKSETPAVITVSGEGLERVVGGVLYDGIANMIQVIILCLLLFGSIRIMQDGEGDKVLLNALGKVAKTATGAEITVSLMVIILSGIMGLNAPAILAVGASFAKPLGKQHGISPYRMANLMDAQSNTLAYCVPWAPAMIYTLGFAADSNAPLVGIEVTPNVIYCFAMFFVMCVSIALKVGRKDLLDKLPPEMRAEYDHEDHIGGIEALDEDK